VFKIIFFVLGARGRGPLGSSVTPVALIGSKCGFSTYYVAFDEPMPGAVPGSEVESEKRRRAVSYYQWVPFVLLSLALLSVCPHVLWRCASRRAGLNVSSIIDTSQSYQKAMYSEPRDHALRYLVAQVSSVRLIALVEGGDKSD